MDFDNSIETEWQVFMRGYAYAYAHQEEEKEDEAERKIHCLSLQIKCSVDDYCRETNPRSILKSISLHLECNMLITSDRYQRTCEALQVFEPSAVSDETDEIRKFLRLRSEYYKEFYRSVSKSGGQDLLVLLPDYRAPGQPLGLEWSRFHREFEEVSFLASGGFGKVFRARNKLDGSVYAVKKVTINCQKLKQVPEQLAEVKTWARLKHNNVVPYNAAWLEKGKSSNRTNSCSAIRKKEEEEAEEEEEEEEEEQEEEEEEKEKEEEKEEEAEEEGAVPPLRFRFSSFSVFFSPRLPPRPHPLLHFLRIQNKKLRDREEFRIRSGGDGEEKKDDDDDDSVVFEGSSAGDENRNQVVKREYPPDRVVRRSARPIVNAKPHLNLKWATLYIQMPLCQQTLREWLDERNASEDFDQFYVKFQQQRFCAEQAVSAVTRNAFCRQSSQLAGEIDPRTSDECLPADSDAASPDGSQTEGPVHHLDVVLDVFQQLLNGLNYIHSRGIVHHDIKPSNIFVSRSDHDSAITIQLGDFGLACPLQSSHAGVGFGTLLYGAPEQLKGKERSDPKADIYSLGVVLLELLVPSFTDMERFKMIEKVRRGQYPPDLDSDFTALLKNMLQKQPSRRPGMLDLEEAFNRIRIKRYKVKSELRQSLSLRDDETVCLRAQIDEQQRVQLESDEERLVQERCTSRTLVVKEQELIYMSLKIKNKEIELRSKEMELRTKDEEICKLKEMLRTYQEKEEGQSGDANGQETNGAAR